MNTKNATETHDAATLRKALIDAGLNQSELANRLGIHRNTVGSAIRHGLNRGTLDRIKEELKISLN